MDDKSFCALPWVHLNVNPDGAATLCCQSWMHIDDGAGREVNLQTHSTNEIWNGAGLRDIRRRMLAGEQLKHCDACFYNERYGRDSYRLQSNRRWLQEHPRAAEIKRAIESSVDGHMPLDPLYFDLRIGNLCNLKCTCCKPLYSSQIEADPVHSRWVIDAAHGRFPNRFTDADEWSQSDALLHEIMACSGELSRIQLAGGEPTINKVQIGMLRRLCDEDRAKNIDLEVVTNLTNVREEIYDIFSRFQSLAVDLSIDGHGPVYEYVRFPAKWHMLTRNVRRLREIRPDVRLTINFVLQALNALNLVDLLSWADDESINLSVTIGRGLNHYNDFRILPAAARAEMRRRLDEFFLRKSNRDLSFLWNEIDTALREMDESDFDDTERREKMPGLMQFINDMDRSRRLSFRDISPDTVTFLVDYLGAWDERSRYFKASA
jgi:sulfatase maturation enzyme AslB (radical SAM superfamily)